MPKKYSDEFKQKVIRRYEQGESIKSMSQELHLAQSTIYRWTKELCSIETSVRKYTPAEFGGQWDSRWQETHYCDYEGTGSAKCSPRSKAAI